MSVKQLLLPTIVCIYSAQQNLEFTTNIRQKCSQTFTKHNPISNKMQFKVLLFLFVAVVLAVITATPVDEIVGKQDV